MSTDRRSYRFSPRAENDLEEIWTYTARTWSRDQANRYIDDIFDAVDGLAQGARIGRDAGNIHTGYLKYTVGRHLLFYKLTAERLDIIRILHQRMDVTAHLKDR